MESAYKSVKDRVGKIIETVRSFDKPIPHIFRETDTERKYRKQIQEFGTPEAVMNEELRAAGDMLTLLTPTPDIPLTRKEASKSKATVRNLNNAIRLIDYAREQMGTSQEYQDTRQAQALGMSSLASGPVRMPSGVQSTMTGRPITFAPQQAVQGKRTPSRARSLGQDLQSRIKSLGFTPVERNPAFQAQRQTGTTPPQGMLVPVLSGLTTPPRRTTPSGATSRQTSEPPSTGLSTGLAQLLEEDQGTIVPSGSGRYKGRGKAKAKAKGKARLKSIREEVVELIKPARTTLPYLDMNNDVFLVNKLHGKTT
jgi:hypothetical protein